MIVTEAINYDNLFIILKNSTMQNNYLQSGSIFKLLHNSKESLLIYCKVYNNKGTFAALIPINTNLNSPK